MLELAVKTLLAYLLGSLIGSLIVGQLRGGVDIRTMRTGNAGGTNALRTQGFGFAAWVMLIDLGKGWVAERHDMVDEYTHEYPESQLPAIAPCSPPSSSDASRVLSASRAAAT